MSVVGIALESPDSPQASFELGKFRVTRKFKVETNSYLDGPVIVALAPGLPVLFEPYIFGAEFLPVVLCRSVTPERMGPNSLFWEVTCEYESPDPKDIQQGDGGKEGKGQDGGGSGVEQSQQYENPLAALPEVELHTQTHKEVAYAGFDGSGNAIPFAASNGEVYVPAPEKEVSRVELRITRNESISTGIIATILTYQDAVNADPFWGTPAGGVKCASISIQRLQKNYPDGSNFPYLKVTYVFHFRDSWDITLLDKGTWYWDSTATKKIKFKTDDQNNIEGLLDGTGKALPSGGSPVFTTIRVYNRAYFSILGLPQTFLDVQ